MSGCGGATHRAVMAESSVTRAARRLSMSQPAVSNTLHDVWFANASAAIGLETCHYWRVQLRDGAGVRNLLPLRVARGIALRGLSEAGKVTSAYLAECERKYVEKAYEEELSAKKAQSSTTEVEDFRGSPIELTLTLNRFLQAEGVAPQHRRRVAARALQNEWIWERFILPGLLKPIDFDPISGDLVFAIHNLKDWWEGEGLSLWLAMAPKAADTYTREKMPSERRETLLLQARMASRRG